MKLPAMTALEHGAFVFAGLLIYIIATRTGEQRRHPSAAIAWVVAIAAFPYLAIPLFLTFGRRKFVRPAHAVPAARGPASSRTPQWANALLTGLGLPEAVANASVSFQPQGPDSLAALIGLIGGAGQTLEIGTFMLGADEVGNQVTDALVAAAARGVRARVLVDSVGNLKSPQSLLRRLRGGGVEVRSFMPLLHNPMRGRTNLRNHRKLAVADGARLWSGGRNLAREYFLNRPGRPAWVDLSFVAVGPVAAQARAQFEIDWATAGGRVGPSRLRIPAVSHPDGPTPAQWIPSGPDLAEDTLHALLMTAAYHARDRILAVTPYFVPDEALLEAWCMACHRGVRISLVVPRQSNHRLADWARERALRRLVQCGGQVWLAPVMVHAKAVVVDDELALCGSLNLDGRSLFLNYEVMTAFYGPAEVAWLAQWQARLVAQAQPYRVRRPAWWRDLLEGLVRSIGFQL
jgi:cardiolipin synthase